MLRFSARAGGAALATYFASTFILEHTPEHRYKSSQDLRHHPYAIKLMERGYVVAPYAHDLVPGMHTRHMVTTSLLAGEGRVREPPLTLISPDSSEQHTLYHLGHDLSEPANNVKGSTTTTSDADKPHRVHYGAAITLLDEGLARAAFQQLPHRAGLTAKLELEPHLEIMPDSYAVLIATSEKTGTRRATARGSLFSLNGKELGPVLVSGSVLMVEPRWAGRFGFLLRSMIAEH